MKSIFISGGAAGIGRAVALRFLAEGWTVGVYDVDEDALQKLRDAHPEIITGKLDVTDFTQWEDALADFTSHTGGRLDVLDNNAGIIGDGTIADQSAKIIVAQNAINCTGVVFGAKAAHPYLKKTPGAHLVNMGSASAIYGQPGIAPYSASKFYVLGFTQALNIEWEKEGVRVVSLMPLWAKTKLAGVSAKSTRSLGVKITPEQVADKVWDAVHPANALERQRQIYSVSKLDLAFRYMAKITPALLLRLINKKITGF